MLRLRKRTNLIPNLIFRVANDQKSFLPAFNMSRQRCIDKTEGLEAVPSCRQRGGVLLIESFDDPASALPIHPVSLRDNHHDGTSLQNRPVRYELYPSLRVHFPTPECIASVLKSLFTAPKKYPIIIQHKPLRRLLV